MTDKVEVAKFTALAEGLGADEVGIRQVAAVVPIAVFLNEAHHSLQNILLDFMAQFGKAGLITTRVNHSQWMVFLHLLFLCRDL